MDEKLIKLDEDLIVEIIPMWKLQDNYVVTEINGDKLVFNDTATIVWRKIDGIKNIKNIINEMQEQFGDQNSLDYIKQITLNCISMFMTYNLIALRSEDFFGEWMND